MPTFALHSGEGCPAVALAKADLRDSPAKSRPIRQVIPNHDPACCQRLWNAERRDRPTFRQACLRDEPRSIQAVEQSRRDDEGDEEDQPPIGRVMQRVRRGFPFVSTNPATPSSDPIATPAAAPLSASCTQIVVTAEPIRKKTVDTHIITTAKVAIHGRARRRAVPIR